jgi:hypothetical protein
MVARTMLAAQYLVLGSVALLAWVVIGYVIGSAVGK